MPEPIEKGIHLRVYRSQDLTTEYTFYVANGPQKRKVFGSRLVETRRIPKKFSEELRGFLKDRKQRNLGNITYDRLTTRSVSTKYGPKSGLKGEQPAPGLGAYLEAIAASHENKRGTTKTFASTSLPSIQRIGQLQKAGHLELNEKEKQFMRMGQHLSLCNSLRDRGQLPAERPAKEWLNGLGKVIKASSKKR